MPGGFTRVHHVGENEAEELKRQMIALRPFEVTFDGPIGIRVLDAGDIGSVVPGSAAADHGITGSHEIVAINGQKVTSDMSEAQIVQMLGPKPVKVLFRLVAAAPAIGSKGSIFGGSSTSPSSVGSSRTSRSSEASQSSSMFGVAGMARMFHRSTAATTTPGKDLLAFEVACPPNHSTGELFRMQAPNSRMYEVKVPKHIKPGDKFIVHVDATVTCDGYLHKLSNSRFKGFQKRWFQIHQGALEYYEHQNEAKAQLEGLPTVKPLKVLPLSSLVQVLDHFGASKANVSTDPHVEFQCTFADLEGDKTLYLRASNTQDKRVWVSALKQASAEPAVDDQGTDRQHVRFQSAPRDASASVDADSLRARSVAANHKRELREAANTEKLQRQRQKEQHWHDAMTALAACVGVDATPPPLLTAEQIDTIRSGEQGEKRVGRLVSHRNRMIRELISTERTYGAGLRSILVNYFAPMTRGDVKHLVTPNICQLIFSNLNQVAQAQCTLQGKLDAAWEAAEAAQKTALESEDAVISVLPFMQVMMHVLPSLHAYEQYVSNFDNASRQVKALEEGAHGWWSKDPLQVWLRETSRRISRPLRALLILPVQRLPRYALLFKTILKESTLQVERDALQAVIDLTDSISRNIEELSVNKANMVEMASTYRRLVRGTTSETARQNFEDLLQPHRRVVRSGSVAAARVALMDGEHTLEKPMMLLFSDTIVIAEPVLEKGVKEGEEDLKYVDKIDLEEMLVQRDPEKQLELVIGGEQGFGGAHSWHVSLSGELDGELEKWESSFHEVGAVFIGKDGKDEEEAHALRMAQRAPTLPAAADLLSGRQRLRTASTLPE